MAAKPRSRIRSSALAVVATAIGSLAFAGASVADTGGVYFDGNNNAAAGDPDFLFNATFTGSQDVGLGRTVMPNLTSGSNNVAAGTDALFTNETGNDNVAAGLGALFQNSVGSNNVAAGSFALSNNQTGNNNVATGTNALVNNASGNHNVAIGATALVNTTGSSNIALGPGAGQNLATGSHNIDIGNDGKAGESKAIRIGTQGDQNSAFIAGVSGKTVKGTAQPVVINNKGQLGTAGAASAATSAKTTSADGRLRAKVNRLQRAVRQLRAEVQRGR